jgi:ribosomal protein S18 acetylase RimI-like enzyme
MRIREATISDARRLAEIHIKTWRAAYAEILPEEFLQSLDIARRAAEWAQALSGLPGSAAVFVAEVEENAEVIGFASIGESRDEGMTGAGELFAIYVDPCAARRGAGRALVAASENAFRERGFTDATLWVLDDNVGARQFYENLGWAAEAKTKTVTIGGVPLVERRHSKAIKNVDTPKQ